MSELKLIIDKREDSDRRKAIVDYFTDTLINTDEQNIEVGDYLAYNEDKLLYCIEFKAYGDFISSMKNGHLVSQLQDMEAYEYPYLFIVGDYFEWRRRSREYQFLTREQVMGFLTSITAKYKTKVFYYKTLKEAMNGMRKLFELHLDGFSHAMEKLPERQIRTGNPNQDMYMALPTIGAKKCKSYMDKMSFFEFITRCKYEENPKEFFKSRGLAVVQSLIDYCKEL